jgi:hypothetical protein
MAKFRVLPSLNELADLVAEPEVRRLIMEALDGSMEGQAYRRRRGKLENAAENLRIRTLRGVSSADSLRSPEHCPPPTSP